MKKDLEQHLISLCRTASNLENVFPKNSKSKIVKVEKIKPSAVFDVRTDVIITNRKPLKEVSNAFTLTGKSSQSSIKNIQVNYKS